MEIVPASVSAKENGGKCVGRQGYTKSHLETMAMMREFRVSHSSRQIVPHLSEQGYRTGKPFTASTVGFLVGERTKVIQ